MADLDRLRDEFAAAFAAGQSPDPAEWLARVGADQRQELERRIDQYLMTAPRRAWDAEAYERSLAKIAVDRVFESREGVSGSWPVLLPRLRHRARIKRADLVRRLTEAVGETDVEKVGVYYNRMEHGALPADGVSATVLEALAGLVGSSVAALRAAGTSGAAPGAEAGAAFARLAAPDPAYAEAVEEDRRFLAELRAPEERDRIDELFTGG